MRPNRLFIMFAFFASVPPAGKAAEPTETVLDWTTLTTSTASPTVDAIDFFESKIRPLLPDYCYECHNA